MLRWLHKGKGKTMKPLKKANQKNVYVQREFYNDSECYQLRNIKGVFDNPFILGKFDELLVSLQEVKDLSVALDQFGYYCIVADMKSGEKIIVNL